MNPLTTLWLDSTAVPRRGEGWPVSRPEERKKCKSSSICRVSRPKKHNILHKKREDSPPIPPQFTKKDLRLAKKSLTSSVPARYKVGHGPLSTGRSIDRDPRWVRRGLFLAKVSSMAETREVMDIREASQYLGVSRDTLYKYVYDERIPAFKLGNRWKFKKTVLDRWMERQSTQHEGRVRRRSRAAAR